MTATVLFANQSNLELLTSAFLDICGLEKEVNLVVNHNQAIFLSRTSIRMEDVTAGFACAFHMHQPAISAGISGGIIGNLQYMFNQPND